MYRPSNREIKPNYKSVQIFKDQTLGTGSYGAVCKAKCDDLLCAAKILHVTLLDPHWQVSPGKERRLPIKRFELEYEILSTLRHPNIVQYLTICQDPDTRLPVLLMELIEESLTHYLETIPHPVPYHTQVNICHSVASALSYLHANNIVHRDVSSNDILVAGNAQVVKLYDFGISAIDISNRDDLTMCPGTNVYMPPEAVTDDPKYTEKIDCFSFGVVMIQVLTAEFPRPSNRRKYIDDPKFEFAIAVLVPEIERRQNHISMIDRGHPLLPIALDCLKDRDMERPTAHQLYERIGELKETPQYAESKSSSDTGIHEQLQRERRQQQEQSQEEIRQLRDEIRQKEILVEEVFENAKQQQALAVEREVQNERRRIAQLEQNQEQARQQVTELQRQVRVEQQRVLQSEARAREQARTEDQLQERTQKEHELTQARQQISDLQQQIRVEQQCATRLKQQLKYNQEAMRRVDEQRRQEQSQKEHELTQARQQISDLQQQIGVEQQRALQVQIQAREQIARMEGQLHTRIRELERNLEQSEVEALGSRVTGLQLLPQGDSWNVPRREIRIIEQIGYGAAGLVSKGRYQGQEVAVKQIHGEILREKHIMDEFKREVGIMATIQHPNLVQFIAAVFDERVEQLRETPLLVLELLHTNLRDAYKDFNLDPSKSVPIFRDVAYGLHYLHEHSEPIIHRDVSSPNILLESLPGETWRAKLSDFGSANFLKRAKTLGVGAVVYTAPEMFPREGPSAPMPHPTTKCDVFSYGIVLVEVITKTMPTTENRHELFDEVERKWRLMHDLVSRCTEVSPHARPTMADVLNTLNRIPTARLQ